MADAPAEDIEDRPLIGEPEPRCAQCQYDLRYAPSRVCPECGAPRALRVKFTSPEDLGRALAILQPRKLIVLGSDPDVEPGRRIGTGALLRPGTIWIRADRQEAVMALLEEAGIVPDAGVPIVDRREPVCPHCAADLDPEKDEACPQCGGAIEWVEIPEPDITHVNRNCRVCGYELRGLAAERCPECGAAIPVDLDALVKAATNAADSGPGWRARVPGQSSAQAVMSEVLRSLAGLIAVATLPIGFLLVVDWVRGELATWALLASCGLLGLLALLMKDIVFPRRGGRGRR